MKTLPKLVILILFFAILKAVYAATPGFYFGAGAGQSKLNTSNGLFERLNAQSVSDSKKQGGLGGRVFAGYNLSCYLGLEVGYARYADSKYNSTAANASGTTANGSAKYYLYAYDLVGKAYLPLSSSGFNAYILGGVARASNTAKLKLTTNQNASLNTSPTTAKYRPKYGVGLSYDTVVTTSLELTRIQGSGDVKTSVGAIPTANMITLNLAYHLG